MASTALTLTICYNSQAHPGCIQQTKPHHLTRIRPTDRVEKILKKFCKKSKLDPENEVQNLELHRCYCNQRAEESATTLLKSRKRIRQTDLEEGDSIFVKRIDRMDVDENENENGDASNPMLEATNSSSESENVPKEEEITKRTKKPLDNTSRRDAYRKQTIDLLGGDAFLFNNSFSLPFSESVGQTYWKQVAFSTTVAMRMTPSSQRKKKDGLFPSNLIQLVNENIQKRREKTSVRFNKRVTRDDFVTATEIMRSQALLEIGQHDPILAPSAQILEPSSGTTKNEKELLSLIRKIDALWKNTAWKRQRLRSDLGTLSLFSNLILREVHKLAVVTPAEDESIVGFPPLVLQALRDALKQDETAVSKGELKPNTSPSSWAQERVLKAALPILRDYLETDEVDAGLFGEESESPSTLPAASGSKSSKETQPADLKVSKKRKRKLADHSTAEEEKRKVKKKSNKKKKRKEG